MIVPGFLVFWLVVGNTLAMTTPRYTSSSPSLKREVHEESWNGQNSAGSSETEEDLSQEKHFAEDFSANSLNEELNNFSDGDVNESNLLQGSWGTNDFSNEHWNARNSLRKLSRRRERANRSLKEPSKINRNKEKLKQGMLRSRSCDTPSIEPGKETTNVPAWSLDTGIFPESLAGNGANDGLSGLSAKPQGPNAPSLNGGNNIPWFDVFGAKPVAEQGGSSSSNAADQNGDSFSNDGGTGDQSDTSFSDGNENGSPFTPEEFNNNDEGNSFSTDNQNEPFFSGTDNQGNTDTATGTQEDGFLPSDNGDIESASSNPSDQCTCVSILECGASFRSFDLKSEENPCSREGEVCCLVAATLLPPTSGFDDQPVLEGTTSSLQCGQSRPVSNVKAGVITDVTAQFAEFPWTVLLTSQRNEDDNGYWTYRCAGSLIHPRVVLTAAHCLDNQVETLLNVRAGDWDLSQNRVPEVEPLPNQNNTVESFIKHPSYREFHSPHDVALLLLSKPFQMTDNVNTICLPSGTDEFDETQCVASGWGNLPDKTQQDVLKKIVMPIVPRDQCQKALRQSQLGKYFKLDKNFVCAGGQFGKDMCQGDGGAPLVCPRRSNGDMVLVGITSWGIDCGQLGMPGVFVDVSKYLDWLNQELNRLTQQ